MYKDRYSPMIQRRLQEQREYRAMINAGWRPYPPNASIDDMSAAISVFGRGGLVEWYPPGYVEEPIISAGKLRVADDPVDDFGEYEPVEPRRKLFGLF